MRSQLKQMMDYCTFCPKMCRFSCPVSEATKNETYTPWGKMEIARWVMDKNLHLSAENILPVYQCTNCLHCQIYCEHLNDVPEALLEVRKLAVENYIAPPEVFKIRKNFSKFHNPYGSNLAEKATFPKVPRNPKTKPEVLFFVSCHTLRHFPERVKTYAELLEKLNVSNVIFQKEKVQCCGEPLRAMGFEDEFKDNAEIQFHHLKKYKYIVVDDAECCNSLKNNYSQFSFSLQENVLHLLEFLAPYLEHSNYHTHGKVKKRLAFYDSPHLARFLDITELPRKIINYVTGFPPLELSMNKKDTLSSGAGGSYELVFPKESDNIAARTIEEVSSRGIQKLITACSKAEVRFRRVAKGIEVQDLSEFLNDHILKP